MVLSWDDPATMFAAACDNVRRGLRRMEHGRHVIFYRRDTRDIIVTRVLHQRMLPDRHAVAGDDEEDE